MLPALLMHALTRSTAPCSRLRSGVIILPLEQGFGTLRFTLMLLGYLLSIFLVGIVLICAAYATPVKGKVTSLDGMKVYPPHVKARNGHASRFAPTEEEEKTAADAAYCASDAKTKLDTFIGLMMAEVAANLAASSKSRDEDTRSSLLRTAAD